MAAADLREDAVRVPDAFVALVSEPLWDLAETGGRRLRAYRQLRRRQWDAPQVVAERRARRLAEVVGHAGRTCPFWAERFAASAFDPRGVREVADLGALPVLTKDDVRERGDDLVSRAFEGADLVLAKTGGSTGIALRVKCDRGGVALRNGAALLVDTWSGWRIGQPTAAVWGNPPVPRTFKQRLRRALKDRVVFLDTMRIDDAAIDRFLALWRRLRPGLLFGHAHSLFILAESLEARGIAAPRPGGIVATSMMLLQPERETIARVFGTPVTNRYGCEELGLIGCECERHDGMHLSEFVAVEVLRDDGSPCDPGEDGRLVITDLVNRGQPLIRYEVGDRGTLAAGPCACGRGWPLLARLTGRTADFLLALDGSRVAGVSLIENTLTRLTGIRQLQLVQEERGAVAANLVPAVGYSELTARELAATLQRALGAGLRVEIHVRDRIAQDPSGKYRFSVCRVLP